LCAVYLARFFNYRRHLAPGERGTVMVIAADRKQSRVVLRFIRALLMQVPMLARMIERETAESFDLNNSVTIEVATASYRTTRGYSIVAALLDELAFSAVTTAAPTLTTRSLPRSNRRWRPSRTPCCCALRRRMRSVARCLPPSRRTSAETVIRSWCGARRPAR